MRQKESSRWQQKRFRTLILVAGILLLISLACNLPTELPIDNPFTTSGYVGTSVAETLIVIEVDQLPTGTDTGFEGTQTPGEDISLTVTPTDISVGLGDAKVYMSENTNCRTGQGTSFERLMILLKGEEAEIVGVDTSGNYWYIRRPDQPTAFCWLWAKHATPTGPYESLPVYTPVPTPTPGFDFEISYHSSIGLCGGFHVLQYRITNNGSVPLESWRTSSTDHTGGSVPVPNQQDKFFDITGCAPIGDKLNLLPGETYFVNAMFTNNPAGHDITVAALICSENGLGGGCISRTIRHTP